MRCTLTQQCLELGTHGVDTAASAQGMLSKASPGPSHRCLVQKHIRNVWWLGARVVSGKGAKAVLFNKQKPLAGLTGGCESSRSPAAFGHKNVKAVWLDSILPIKDL